MYNGKHRKHEYFVLIFIDILWLLRIDPLGINIETYYYVTLSSTVSMTTNEIHVLTFVLITLSLNEKRKCSII